MAVTTTPFSSERGDRCQRSLGQVSLWDGTQILFWLARCRWCSRDLQSIVQASENCWSLERCVWLRFSWSGWSCDTTHMLFFWGTQSWWSISSGGKHGTLNICISHHNWTRNGAKEGNTKEQWDNKSKSLFQWEISPGGNPLPLLLFFFPNSLYHKTCELLSMFSTIGRDGDNTRPGLLLVLSLFQCVLHLSSSWQRCYHQKNPKWHGKSWQVLEGRRQ